MLEGPAIPTVSNFSGSGCYCVSAGAESQLALSSSQQQGPDRHDITAQHYFTLYDWLRWTITVMDKLEACLCQYNVEKWRRSCDREGGRHRRRVWILVLMRLRMKNYYYLLGSSNCSIHTQKPTNFGSHRLSQPMQFNVFASFNITKRAFVNLTDVYTQQLYKRSSNNYQTCPFHLFDTSNQWTILFSVSSLHYSWLRTKNQTDNVQLFN